MAAEPPAQRSFRAIGNPYLTYQSKRRDAALQRQKAARLQSANRARELALDQRALEDDASEDTSQLGSMQHNLADAGQPEVDSGARCGDGADEMEASTSSPASSHGTGARRAGGAGGRGGSSKARSQGRAGGSRGRGASGQAYGNELMQPEWMTDVPGDLATNWLVMPRPEGTRCLLVASRGRTTSWLRNGARLHVFHSRLPGGSPATAAAAAAPAVQPLYGSPGAAAAAHDYCILDCVYHQPDDTYYVQDLLCWRGYALYDCTAEFRAFWLASKFADEGLHEPGGGAPGAAGAGTAGGAAAGATAGSWQQQQQQEPDSQGAAAANGRGQGMDAAEGVLGGGGPHPVDEDMGDAAAGGEGQEQQQQRGGGGGRRGRGGGQHRGRGGGGRGRGRALSAVGAEGGTHRIVPLPVHPCTREGFAAAYGPPLDASQPQPQPGPAAAAAAAPAAATAGPGVVGPAVGVAMAGIAGCAFVRDGLYLLHRQGHYAPGPAPTPLALLWKDLGCSRYLLDTDPQGRELEVQQAVLAYRPDGTVATSDEPPVVLGRLPAAFLDQLAAKAAAAEAAAAEAAAAEAAAAAAAGGGAGGGGRGGMAAGGGAAGAGEGGGEVDMEAAGGGGAEAAGASGAGGAAPEVTLKPGRLLRFSIREGGIMFHAGRPCGADLRFDGLVHSRRARPDTFSKLLFQWLARHCPEAIALPALLAALQHAGDGAGEAMADA